MAEDTARIRVLLPALETQQANVGQQLQFQLEQTLLALLTGGGLAWRTVDRALEMHVAQAALAALGDQQAVAVPGQVADHFVGLHIDHHGTDRHHDDAVFAALAVGLAAHAVLAALRLEGALMAEIDQRVDVLVGHDPDATARTAIAAIGPTQRNELRGESRHSRCRHYRR